MRDYSIRDSISPQEIYFRINRVNSSQLKNIQNGLKKLHAFEVMATNIYKKL